MAAVHTVSGRRPPHLSQQPSPPVSQPPSSNHDHASARSTETAASASNSRHRERDGHREAPLHPQQEPHNHSRQAAHHQKPPTADPRAASSHSQAQPSQSQQQQPPRHEHIVPQDSVEMFRAVANPMLDKDGRVARNRPFTEHIVSADYKPSIKTSKIRRNQKIEQHYRLENIILGTGISGAVCTAVHRGTGRRYAVKTLQTQNISPKKAAMLYNEISIYLKLDHPNIAKLIDVYEDEKSVKLVMELCTGRELYDRLAERRKYSERDAALVTKQMLEAINYCHRHKTCHRDLKLENWVYGDASEDAKLKLIDFGFSRIFNPGVPMTAMHGTVYYVSPEVLQGCYDEVCDIWSIGVIVYMLLSGSPPFNGTNDHEILAKIKRGTFSFAGPRWAGASDLAKDFIKFLLERDQTKRPSAERALKHPWITQLLRQNATTESPMIDVSVLQNMRRFSLANHMKRAALGVLALSMHTKELQELEAVFQAVDKEGTGTITLQSLTEALTESLKIPESEAARIFHAIDVTGSQEIHYTEFLASTLQAKFVLHEKLIREAFQRFDSDLNGYISADSLKAVLGDEYNGAKIEEMMRMCDLKGEGRIDFDEFLAALTSDEVITLGIDQDFDDFCSPDDDAEFELAGLDAMMEDAEGGEAEGDQPINAVSTSASEADTLNRGADLSLLPPPAELPNRPDRAEFSSTPPGGAIVLRGTSGLPHLLVNQSSPSGMVAHSPRSDASRRTIREQMDESLDVCKRISSSLLGLTNEAHVSLDDARQRGALPRIAEDRSVTVVQTAADLPAVTENPCSRLAPIAEGVGERQHSSGSYGSGSSG
uniref:non-specific serine/threonine protein kinase n=1 Tax=Chromera velia CCMP2878 TaxID=1169474 RepID=A0A0G4I0R2_9ALVE|eukprot:Cvel_10005.t1-p1 / transcript=Cvel_10005.t1 / gene=Cvel_10005 / organism=Chromera_velia_CCMP2878 / gene_product=Calcium-dependent protein kinase 2, putative / transcript_product=Calcium-dependent protein kinase 2, putative / location=Cvel_scaffold593:28347-31699(+) / protein_length=824 / sequence_SO=supercontig / SO=protein_coding / is_pseudo=false